MTAAPSPSLSADLAHQVEAFEAALIADAGTDLAEFLTEESHPLYLSLLVELIRVDLEHAWSRGQRRSVAVYTARFPVLLEQPAVLGSIAFEEYRQRRQAGESVRPDEYRTLYGADTSEWPSISVSRGDTAIPDESDLLPPTRLTETPSPSRDAASPNAALSESSATGRISMTPSGAPESDDPYVSRWAQAAAALPEAGTEFLGFHLVEEIGRGAFGRVYLARQGDLAGRPVALKIACDIFGESQTLAQLQHTNIVPIYSFHRTGPFQAVCMPFFGRTTLAQVLNSISGRPSLPSSGREVRSTVFQGHGSTLRTRSALKSDPGVYAPTPMARPAPALPESPAAPPLERAAHDGWTRLEGLSYVEAVLSIGGELASGLAHSHRQGILHRDLKPANILLTDEGRPMLLDFNLAEDVKLRGSAARAAIGGTLPYMAPEQIEAFRNAGGKLDGRCDIYSLGVMLFELLTGRHPFPRRKGPGHEIIDPMLADRRQPLPSLRPFNPAVSSAVESIIHKCLAADPDRRYQTADDLREDIDRHLANRPLKHAPNPSLRERTRKWARRHPKLASSGSVATVAAALLVLVISVAIYSRERTRGIEARGLYADHQAAFFDAQAFLDDRNRSWPQLDEGLEKLRSVLARYDVPEEPGGDIWLESPAVRYLPEPEQARVRQDIGEVFYLMAQAAHLKAFASADPEAREAAVQKGERWNELAGHYAGDRLPRAIREQRAALAEIRGDTAERDRLLREAAAIPAQSARDRFLAGAQLAQKGHYRDALPRLREATQIDPTNFSAWFVRGTTHLALEQNDLAAFCFAACTALRPDFAPAWLNRGLSFTRMRHYAQARDDYDRAVSLDPDLTEAFIQRAGVKDRLGDRAGAVDDFTRALATGAAPVRVYFLRASLRDRMGDREAAKADREAGLKLKPTDELSWVARGESRMAADPAGALTDVEEALKLNPLSAAALQLKSHLLSEKLNRRADAIAVLDRAVELYPDHVPARAGRGVLLARDGRRDEAIRDAKDALLRNTDPPNLFQVGCIYALTSKTNPEDRVEALRLLSGALQRGFGLQYLDTDHDLDPLRDDAEFKRLVAAAKAKKGK